MIIQVTLLELQELKIGDICEVSDLEWADNFSSIHVKRPDGTYFWYYKYLFTPISEIRENKLKKLGIF